MKKYSLHYLPLAQQDLSDIIGYIKSRRQAFASRIEIRADLCYNKLGNRKQGIGNSYKWTVDSHFALAASPAKRDAASSGVAKNLVAMQLQVTSYKLQVTSGQFYRHSELVSESYRKEMFHFVQHDALFLTASFAKAKLVA